MLADDLYALLMYPTNELILDQVKQVERHIKDFKLGRPYQTLFSDSITEEVEKHGTLSRSSVILTWLKNRDFILSNPDLFHLMSSYNYGSSHDKREYVYQIPDNFDYFLFDEFHIFGPPQVISVLNILNYHKVAAPHRKLKYVFLSATPTRMFKRSHINCQAPPVSQKKSCRERSKQLPPLRLRASLKRESTACLGGVGPAG